MHAVVQAALAADLTMTIYAAEPSSPTEHALALLASWAATPNAPSTEPHAHADERVPRNT